MPSSTSSGRRGRTGARTTGAAPSRAGCASRRSCCGGSASAVARTSSSGWRSAWTPEAEATPGIEELAEIVAWHDERRLMDYVTCGTGSYFGVRGDHPAVALRAAAGRALRRGAQGGRSPRGRPGREPHPDARRGRGRPRGRPCRSGQHRARPDRRPASRREGASRAPRSGPAVHLVQPAVLGPPVARLLDLVPDQSVRRAGVRVGRRPVRAQPDARARSSSSAADRPDWRRRVSRRSAAIT